MKPGDQVGRYTLEAVLGEGGMGQVYRAFDTVLRRRVALKLLRPTSAPSARSDVDRVLREARMAAAFSHPNVVAIYDVGEHDAVPFIVMEHVTGSSLRTYVGDPSVTLARRVGWLVALARALAAAHHAGLVHRDIKPENVMIADDGVLKVLDFGIARRTDDDAAPPSARRPRDASSSDAPGRTADETASAGTPAYMAPEQITRGPIDGRADQFAWGIVAYELLTGLPPWRTDAGTTALLRALIQDPPPPIDCAATGVPESVAAIVLHALEKAPQARFPDMDALLDALDATREQIPASVQAPSTAGPVAFAPTIADVRSAHTQTASASTFDHGPSRGSRKFLLAGGFLGAAAVFAGAVILARRPRTAAPFEVHEQRRLTLEAGCQEFPSMLADGKSVLFDAASGVGDYHVFAVDLASGARREVTREAGWQWGASPSPDGREIAFLSNRDGTTSAIVRAIDGAGDGKLLVRGQLLPAWSPDGKALWAGDVEQPTRHDRATHAPGRRLTPPPTMVLTALVELRDGRVVARAAYPDGRAAGFVVYRRDRDAEPTWAAHGEFDETLVPTADGNHILALRDLGGGSELVRVPLEGGQPTVLPGTVLPTKGLAFSATFDRIVWSTCRGTHDLVLLAPARAGSTTLVARPLSRRMRWSEYEPMAIPGRSSLLVVSDRVQGSVDPWIVEPEDPGKPRRIAIGSLGARIAVPSPDGKLVAFSAVKGGVYVVPIDGGAPRQVSKGHADDHPSWARGGERIYFETREADGRRAVAVVPVEGGAPVGVLDAETGAPAVSPAADELLFLEGPRDASRPMVLDLTTRERAPLAADLPAARYQGVRVAPDGSKVGIFTSSLALVVDRATGRVLERFDSGLDQVTGMTFTADGVVVSRTVWEGEFWTATGRFR